MKTLKRIALLASLMASALATSAQVFDFQIDTPQTIPDGGSFAPPPLNITGAGPFDQGFLMKVRLNIQAFSSTFPAANGDYYSTLTHTAPNGSQALAVLLNRPGKSPDLSSGYGDNGMNITIQDFIGNQAAPDIHTYKTVTGFEGSLAPLTGTWAPDGRAENPASGVTTDSRNALLSVFNGMDPNGEWVLFLQDASSGTGQGQLVSASLEFIAVPEPSTYALVAGLALIGFALYRRGTLKVA